MRSGLVDAAASNPDRAVVYEALAEAERDKRTRAANWVAGGVEEDSPAAGPAENTQRRNTDPGVWFATAQPLGSVAGPLGTGMAVTYN